MSKATSFDIAYYAGVSQSTVSRALRNSPLVSDRTKEKVQRIAEQLNYKVDKNASNLSTQQSGNLALLLFQDPTADDSQINPFFISMISSIIRASNNKGYDLLVSFQVLTDDWHADYEDTRKADGIILLGYGDYTDYRDKLLHLEDQGTHYVRWGAPRENQAGLSIGTDNYRGGATVAEHLLALGRKRFIFVGNISKGSPEFAGRYSGFKQTIEESGTDCMISQLDAVSSEQAGDKAAKALLSFNEPFDAIFCASDIIAIGVMKRLRNAGINIPKDVSIVGFDNIPIAEYVRPPLTTVQQNTLNAGEILVETLIANINSDTPEKPTLLEPKLIVRESCGTPRDQSSED